MSKAEPEEERKRGHMECYRQLIPGLPDDLASDCIARVTVRFHSGLRLVCRRWRDLVTASDFYRHRERIGAAEDLIFLVQACRGGDCEDDEAEEAEEGEKGCGIGSQPPAYGLSAYNVTRESWHRVATSEAVPLFAQIVSVGRKVALLGGWDPASLDPTAEVRVLDPATGGWRRRTPMAEPRSFFACGAVGGRVFVAGGHDAQKNALRTAETYDPSADEWAALPDMEEERDECQGMEAGGRFWAVSGYGTEEQGRFAGAAEWYDAAGGKWRREEVMWEAGGAACVGVAGGSIWSVGFGREGGGAGGVREYEGVGRGWKEVAPLPAGVKRGPRPVATVAVGGGDKERVFVMATEEETGGGHRGWVLEVGPRRWTRVETPVGFTGFVYSAAAVRL